MDYKIIATSKNGVEKVWTLYHGDKIIKDSFNLEVIKKILGRRFNNVYNKRIVKEF